MILRTFTLAVCLLITPAVWAQFGKTDMMKLATDRIDMITKALKLSPQQVSMIKPLLESKENKWLHDWSPDGRYVVYAHDKGIYALPLSGEPKPVTLVENDFSKDEFRVSNDVSRHLPSTLTRVCQIPRRLCRPSLSFSFLLRRSSCFSSS